MKTSEARHMSRVKQMQCLICKRFEDTGEPTEVHHVAEGSGLRSNWSVVPLCVEHHRGKSGFHSSPRGFLMRYRPPGESEYGLLTWLIEDMHMREAA